MLATFFQSRLGLPKSPRLSGCPPGVGACYLEGCPPAEAAVARQAGRLVVPMTPIVPQQTPKSRRRILWLAALVVAGAGIFWYLERSPVQAPAEPVLTPEAKAYTRNLQLSEVQMKATDNALGQTLVEIVGQITNNGDRPLELVELNCVFYDPYGEVVHRERVAIVRARDGVMQPGETRRFRLPFDALPKSWNQVMPQLVIAQIVFAD